MRLQQEYHTTFRICVPSINVPSVYPGFNLIGVLACPRNESLAILAVIFHVVLTENRLVWFQIGLWLQIFDWSLSSGLSCE